MTHQIINLCINALSKLASDNFDNSSEQFDRDIAHAIRSLKKVKKYL